MRLFRVIKDAFASLSVRYEGVCHSSYHFDPRNTQEDLLIAAIEHAEAAIENAEDIFKQWQKETNNEFRHKLYKTRLEKLRGHYEVCS